MNAGDGLKVALSGGTTANVTGLASLAGRDGQIASTNDAALASTNDAAAMSHGVRLWRTREGVLDDDCASRLTHVRACLRSLADCHRSLGSFARHRATI